MGPQFTQQLQPFRLHLGHKPAHTRDVAARTMQAGDDAAPDRVGSPHEHDRNRRGRRLGRQGRWVATYCNNDGHALAHKIGGEPRQSIVLPLCPAIVDGDVLTLDNTYFIETLADDRHERCVDSERTAAEQPNHRKRTLLRTRRERPRRRTPEQRDELAPLHSITSSAQPSSDELAPVGRPFAMSWAAASTATR